MKLTTKQLAEKLDIPYNAAQGLKTFLLSRGLAIKIGEEQKDYAAFPHGKRAIVYEFPEEVHISLEAGVVQK